MRKILTIMGLAGLLLSCRAGGDLKEEIASRKVFYEGESFATALYEEENQDVSQKSMDFGERREAFLDYIRNPVKLEENESVSGLRDPLSLKDTAERKKHLLALKDVFLGFLESKVRPQTLDLVKRTEVIYDEDGRLALTRQFEEIEKDNEFYSMHPNTIFAMGSFKGPLSELLGVYRYLQNSGDPVSDLIRNYRNVVPFSISSFGKDTLFPVYCFPFWYDEFSKNKRGALNSNERNILMLSDLGHEFTHVLFGYGWIDFEGAQNVKDKADHLGVPESHLSGALHLVSEEYGTRYEGDTISHSERLGNANSAFMDRINKEFREYILKNPSLASHLISK